MSNVSHRAAALELPPTSSVSALLAAEAAARAAADVLLDARLDILEAATPVSGTAGQSRLINIRDYIGHVVSGDWGPAFVAALAAAVVAGVKGIFFPAGTYDGALVTGSGNLYSFLLDNLDGFSLVGEGPENTVIRMKAQDAGGSDWSLIRVMDNCSNITIRDLTLDGNKANLTNLDSGEQTHCLKLGSGFTIASGNSRAGYTRNIKLFNVHFKDPDGDGCLLIGGGLYTQGGQVEDVSFINCRFSGSNRNGLSFSRSVRRVRAINCYFEDIENTAIDMEPVGDSTYAAPEDISFIGVQIVHETGAGPAMSISGMAGTTPPTPVKRVILANSNITGGRVGGIDIDGLILSNNHITHGADLVNSDASPVLWLRGLLKRTVACGNQLTRPLGCQPGTVLNISGQSGYYPDGVDLVDNVMHQYTHATAGEAFVMLLENASNVRGARNTVVSYYPGISFTTTHAAETLTMTAHGLLTGRGPCRLINTGGALPTGLSAATNYWVIRVDDNTIKLAASEADSGTGTAVTFSSDGTGTHKLDVRLSAGIKIGTTAVNISSVDLSDNRVLGGAGGCSLIAGISVGSGAGYDIDKLVMFKNGIFDATSQYLFDALAAADFPTPPMVGFTYGSGFTTQITGLASYGPIQTGGNSGGIASYIGSGAPTFAAAQGSLYHRTGGSTSAGTLERLYVNINGNTTWLAIG